MLAHVAQTLTFLMTGHAFRAHCFVDLRRSGRLRRMPTLYLATDPAADELLATDPLALLIGMLLDQQIPLEKAFSSPYVLTQRLGVTRLDATAIADHDPEDFVRVFSTPPALHR